VKRLHDLTDDHIAFVKGLCERSLKRYWLVQVL
jgi:hypothetical protein